jgi:IS30 family transposase
MTDVGTLLGTDMNRYGESELDAVAATLNGRPRKTLGWRTPAEALENLLFEPVATTP